MSFYTSRENYLRTPDSVQPSFHCRVGHYPPTKLQLPVYKPWVGQPFGTVPRGPDKSTPPQPAKAYGFPIPGTQAPTAQSVMATDYFVSDATWDAILSHGNFDYIVVGSGFTALAFINEALRLNPYAKILCLERGDFWLPVHFQNLPLPFNLTLGGASETFPWTLTLDTHTSPVRYMHGSCPFFGGRSTFWSAWSPRPKLDEFRQFPASMIETLSKEEFWTSARQLLNVINASEIKNSIFGNMQKEVDKRMEKNYQNIGFSTHTQSAPMSVGPNSKTSTLRFNKFSVPGKLLETFECQRQLAIHRKGNPLEIALRCAVSRLGKADKNGHVRSMETSRGTLAFEGDTKVILCAGAIPTTTLLLNSFPMVRETAGKCLGGHFLSHITARCPIKKYPGIGGKLQIAAHYLAGEAGPVIEDKDLIKKARRQFHVQITVIHSPDPLEDADDLARECPDYAAAATAEQLNGSEKHVIFVCATLGELDETNKSSFVQLNGGQDPTCNVDLQVTLTHADEELWDDMDKATFDTIAVLSDEDPKNLSFAVLSDEDPTNLSSKSEIEYWDEKGRCWQSQHPHNDTIRIFGVVHEASTLPMNRDARVGPVNEDYQVHGINKQGQTEVVNNVYVTGAGLFPASGSWNPTLTMCGFAQDLAQKLHALQRGAN